MSIEQVKQLIAEHGDRLVRAVADNTGAKLEWIIHAFGDDNENYEGEWNSEEEFAEHIFNEYHAHEVPEHLQSYIDIKGFAHDLFISDYYALEVEKPSSWCADCMITRTHVFRYV